jgi:hypothetical protein
MSRSRIDAEEHLSAPRLKPYLYVAASDFDAAMALYEWNVAVSGAFFESVGALEVGLRNAMHAQLDSWHKRQGLTGEWYDDPNGVFNSDTRSAIRQTRNRIASRAQHETPGKVVSELMFGFWRFLLAGSYQASLWVPCLQHAFPAGTARKDVEDRVAQVHELRNRIAHHEAVHQRDLADDFDVLIGLCEDLHTRLGWWVDARSRVPLVLTQRP